VNRETAYSADTKHGDPVEELVKTIRLYAPYQKWRKADPLAFLSGHAVRNETSKPTLAATIDGN
jgi:hypothetical protein